MKIEYFKGVPLNVFCKLRQWESTKILGVMYSVEDEKLVACLFYKNTNKVNKRSYSVDNVDLEYLANFLKVDYKYTAAYEIDEALK